MTQPREFWIVVDRGDDVQVFSQKGEAIELAKDWDLNYPNSAPHIVLRVVDGEWIVPGDHIPDVGKLVGELKDFIEDKQDFYQSSIAQMRKMKINHNCYGYGFAEGALKLVADLERLITEPEEK